MKSRGRWRLTRRPLNLAVGKAGIEAGRGMGGKPTVDGDDAPVTAPAGLPPCIGIAFGTAPVVGAAFASTTPLALTLASWCLRYVCVCARSFACPWACAA